VSGDCALARVSEVLVLLILQPTAGALAII
jgi:hypothetical protein